MLPLQLRAAHPQSASQLPASALLLVCLVSLFQVAHNSHGCKYLHLFHHDKPPFTTRRAGSSCCAQGWGRSTASSLPTRTILCFNGWADTKLAGTPAAQQPFSPGSAHRAAQAAHLGPQALRSASRRAALGRRHRLPLRDVVGFVLLVLRVAGEIRLLQTLQRHNWK